MFWGKKIRCFLWLLCMLGLCHGQNTDTFSKKQLEKSNLTPVKTKDNIRQDILSVYGQEANHLVFNNPTRYKAIQDIYSRLFVVNRSFNVQEKFKKLTSVPLQNKYNSSLQRSVVFNPKYFNPLQYQLDFFSTSSQMYRVDQTDLLVILLPHQ